MIGNLVTTLGLSQGVALTIVSLLTKGGMTLVSALYPALIPVTVTINQIIAVAGTAAVVAY